MQYSVSRCLAAGLGFGGSLYLHVARSCSTSAPPPAAWRWWWTFAVVPTCDPGVSCCHLLSALFCTTEPFPTLLLSFSVSDNRKGIKVSSRCCMITCYQSSYVRFFLGLHPPMSNYPVGTSLLLSSDHVGSFFCVLPQKRLNCLTGNCISVLRSVFNNLTCQVESFSNLLDLSIVSVWAGANEVKGMTFQKIKK